MTVVLHQSAINNLAFDSPVKNAVDQLGEEVAADARQAAPKRTGEGAQSIRHDVVQGRDGWEARISWDRDHFYMMFAELGTSRQAATPFLRPALQKRRSL